MCFIHILKHRHIGSVRPLLVLTETPGRGSHLFYFCYWKWYLDIRLNENLMLFILANIEHLFKMLLLKGGQDLYLANYQAQHMLPSVTSFRKYNYNWVRLERSGTFQLLAARIYNLSTVACLRVRYLETYDTLYHCPPNPHFICNTQWVCTVTVNWVNVLQPCKFGLAGGCACAHVQYRRVKVDSMLMWHKITPFPRHCVSVPCNAHWASPLDGGFSRKNIFC